MVFIAVEIGVNFRDFHEVKRMIGLAKEAGADGVKFQVFNEQNIKGRPCQEGDLWQSPAQIFKHAREEELLELILKQSDLRFLKDTAHECGIEFFATPMYPEAVDMLENVGVKRYKIRYADRNNEELISKANQTGKEILLSCDTTYLDNMPLDALHSDFDKWTFVFCVPEYPPKTIELPNRFGKYYDKFGGYSNHFPSISVPLAAAARGAEYIEVHVKQDKYCKGFKPIDDAVSITFSELKELVRLTREIEKVVL